MAVDQRFQNFLAEDKPRIMGIVNVTPDSFSDGGQHFDADAAIAHGLRLLEEGADILDIGGESTRPGADPVSVEEELSRVLPVIEGVKDAASWISIDTRHAKVMEEALKAGAHIINDVSALSHDEKSVFVAAEASCPVILMHMQGDPQSMQEKPQYNHVVNDISLYLKDRISYCEMHRIEIQNLVLDPGIGFGKTLENNLLILRNIKEILNIGCPVLLGTSRKSFIGHISGERNAEHRLGGSLSSVIWGLSQGVKLFRVHDVRETRQAVQVYRAISEVGSSDKSTIVR